MAAFNFIITFLAAFPLRPEQVEKFIIVKSIVMINTYLIKDKKTSIWNQMRLFLFYTLLFLYSRGEIPVTPLKAL